MLIQMLVAKPQMIGPILVATPVWVGFLFVGLLVLGASMLRNSSVGAWRAAITPVAMTGLSLWGTVSAFSHSAVFGDVLLVWVVAAAGMAAAVGTLLSPAAVRYDPRERRFAVPGSWVPLALTMGIFLVKYMVGVEVAMNPSLPHDSAYSLTYGAVFGLFSGIFAGRAVRLARAALRDAAPAIRFTVNA